MSRVADQLVRAAGALCEARQHRLTPGASALAADGDGDPEGGAGGAPVLLPRGDQMPGVTGIRAQGWLLRDVDQLAVAVAGGDRTRLTDYVWTERAECRWRRGSWRRASGNTGDQDEQSCKRAESRWQSARHASGSTLARRRRSPVAAWPGSLRGTGAGPAEPGGRLPRRGRQAPPPRARRLPTKASRTRRPVPSRSACR